MLVEQVYIFGWSIVTGMILGLLFDIFRGMRWKGMKDIWVYLQDIVFWIVTGVIIICSTFLINMGELRGYMLIGYLLGAGFYFLLFSKYILGMFHFINRKIRELFHTSISYMKKMISKKNRNGFMKNQKNRKIKQEI